MKRGQYILLVVLTVISGLVGGAVSSRLFERPVAAQESEKYGKVIKAQEFWLMDKDGNIRGMWLPGPSGGSLLGMNGKGKSTVLIDANEGIYIYDENGKKRLTADKNGIGIGDENGKERIDLNTFDGQPSISILDENGKDRTVLGCVDLKTIKTGSKQTTSESSITLFDKDGRTLWRMPMD